MLLEPELSSIWRSSLYGDNYGSHIAVRHTGSFLLHHELTHYFFKGSPSWFSEGSAHFLADYVSHVTEASSLCSAYMYTQDNIIRRCAPLGAANIQEWNEMESGESPNPAGGCQYRLGELFFLGMYNHLGNQVVSSSLRGLYERQVSKGSYTLTEDEIYQQFLADTPLEEQDDFRRLYHYLHGRPVPGYTPAVTNSPDRAALVDLYNATNGSNWRNNTNWLSTEAIDQWYGVSTDCLGRVIRLNLNGNQLAGSIPAQIGALTNLVQMNLSDNQLSGHMPVELGTLTNLERLILQNNQLSGPVPVELGRLVKLDGLYLDRNQLSGPIPRELENLSRLEFLFLHVNQLSGSIPRELGNLANLERLSLYGNQLSGSIPQELRRLDRLEFLMIAGNQLSGPIPVELTDLTRLKTLMLSSNRLSGPIPEELGGLANLEYLLLYNNQLSGPIPEELGNLVNLKYLGLAGNPVTGCIPRPLQARLDLRYSLMGDFRFC